MPTTHEVKPTEKYTGAGTIFGCSGGVMEAALRTAYALLAGEELKNPDIISVRGLNNSLVEATVPIPLKAQGGKIFELRVAVVNGALQDLKNVMKIINEDKDRWHFIEDDELPGRLRQRRRSASAGRRFFLACPDNSASCQTLTR